jgi:putative ABC transport system substrate-binding protein
VDVFVVPGPAAARAVRRATPIPLVAVGLPPVERDPDLFASLARPGCSVTGFASFGEETSAKRIELLREAIPGLSAIGVLHNAADPTFDAWGRLTEASVAAQGLRPIRMPIHARDPAALAAAMRALRAEGASAVVVVRDFLTSSLITEIVAAAAIERLAVIGEQARFAEAGALFSYGASLPDPPHVAGAHSRPCRPRAGVVPCVEGTCRARSVDAGLSARD